MAGKVIAESVVKVVQRRVIAGCWGPTSGRGKAVASSFGGSVKSRTCRTDRIAEGNPERVLWTAASFLRIAIIVETSSVAAAWKVPVGFT